MPRIKKCINCKWAGNNNPKKAYSNSHCTLPNNLPDRRDFKYTTNSKYVTHCSQHEFVKRKIK